MRANYKNLRPNENKSQLNLYGFQRVAHSLSVLTSIDPYDAIFIREYTGPTAKEDYDEKEDCYMADR